MLLCDSGVVEDEQHLDGINHKWANPHFDDFDILGVFESYHHKLYLTKEPNV